MLLCLVDVARSCNEGKRNRTVTHRPVKQLLNHGPPTKAHIHPPT
jgi:hypothetical protein